MAADAAELVHAAVWADIHPVFDGYMTRQSHAVADDDVVADAYVVGHVGVGHQQVIAAYGGQQAAAFGAAMDGDEFANPVAVADARLRSLALVLEVLRRHAHGAVREENVVFADPRGALHIEVGHQAGAGSDFHLGAHDAIRTDLGALRDPRPRIHDCGGMDGHRQAVVSGCFSSLSASLHMTSISATRSEERRV